MTDGSDFGYEFKQNVDMNYGYTSYRVIWPNSDYTACEYSVKLYFTSGEVSTDYECNYDTIWSNSWNLSERDNKWNPYTLENEASRLFLLAQFENQDEESSNTTLIAASVAAGLGLVLAGFALKRKEAVRTDTDSFVRA